MRDLTLGDINGFSRVLHLTSDKNHINNRSNIIFNRETNWEIWKGRYHRCSRNVRLRRREERNRESELCKCYINPNGLNFKVPGSSSLIWDTVFLRQYINTIINGPPTDAQLSTPINHWCYFLHLILHFYKYRWRKLVSMFVLGPINRLGPWPDPTWLPSQPTIGPSSFQAQENPKFCRIMQLTSEPQSSTKLAITSKNITITCANKILFFILAFKIEKKNLQFLSLISHVK